MKAVSVKEMHKRPIVISGVSGKRFNSMPQQIEVNFSAEDVMRFQLVQAGIHIVLRLLGYWPSKQWYAGASLYQLAKS